MAKRILLIFDYLINFYSLIFALMVWVAVRCASQNELKKVQTHSIKIMFWSSKSLASNSPYIQNVEQIESNCDFVYRECRFYASMLSHQTLIGLLCVLLPFMNWSGAHMLVRRHASKVKDKKTNPAALCYNKFILHGICGVVPVQFEQNLEFSLCWNLAEISSVQKWPWHVWIYLSPEFQSRNIFLKFFS